MKITKVFNLLPYGINLWSASDTSYGLSLPSGASVDWKSVYSLPKLDADVNPVTRVGVQERDDVVTESSLVVTELFGGTDVLYLYETSKSGQQGPFWALSPDQDSNLKSTPITQGYDTGTPFSGDGHDAMDLLLAPAPKGQFPRIRTFAAPSKDEDVVWLKVLETFVPVVGDIVGDS